MLVMDRSGSMSGEQRMEYAKASAKQFVNALKVGDSIGLVDFDDQITVTFPLTTITGDATKVAIKAKIDSLTPRDTTNIGGGLLSAHGQITAQAQRSCNEIIVLLTDGDHNTGTDPRTVLPKLQEDKISVFTVGLGQGL